MAVMVKGWPIKSTLQKAINYVADAYKTKDKILVSTHGTSIKYGERDFLEVWNTNTNRQKKVSARHFKQSFAPGEVSPEEAHEIALEFCERFLKGEYQYVVGTHVDTNCIHNHILFNNIRMTVKPITLQEIFLLLDKLAMTFVKNMNYLSLIGIRKKNF